MTRQGLTLIEMLVVMAIIAVLAGITYGGLTRSRGGEGMQAVSSMTANMIRQARHTAMSSGAPVELRVRQNATGRYEISGISQLLIHGEQFENADVLGTDELPLGFAGYGFPVQTLHSWQASSTRIALLRHENDSFFGELYYQPPSQHPGEDPIVLASIIYAADADPLDIGLYPPNDGQYWRAFVGFADGLEAEAEISLQTGHFSRIGWFYRNGQLELLIDRRSVAQVNWTPQDLGSAHRLEIIFGSDDPEHDLGIIDNFRLMRLGADNPVLLPQGIEPDGEYRLLVMPDGQVQSSGTWMFRYTGPGESLYQYAQLSIDSVGRVSIDMPLYQPPEFHGEEN